MFPASEGKTDLSQLPSSEPQTLEQSYPGILFLSKKLHYPYKINSLGEPNYDEPFQDQVCI